MRTVKQIRTRIAELDSLQEKLAKGPETNIVALAMTAARRKALKWVLGELDDKNMLDYSAQDGRS